jgi:hypothetical protein
MGVYDSDVQKLYVAYFNRPADPLGLAYWNEQITRNGGSSSITTVASAFAASDEYQNLYAGKTTAQVIDTIYQNLFGRSAEPAGLSYWGTLLDNGTFKIGTIAYSVYVGAQNDDKTAIDNKATAAAAWTAALDTTAEIVGYAGGAANTIAKNWLTTVTTDASLTAAEASLNATVASAVAASTAVSGQTFTLTTGADTGSAFIGGAGNDTYSGSAGTIDGDNLNGGNGTDTLNLTVTVADDDDAAFTSTGIETISIRATGGAGGDVDLEFGDVSGLETLEFRRLSEDVSIANLQSLDTEISLNNVATDAAIAVTHEAGLTAGTADTLTVTVSASTGGATLTTDGVETLNVAVTGVDSDVNFVDASLETITISGSGNLATDVSGTIAVDASANTGGVSIAVTDGAGVTELTGTSVSDTFTFAAGTYLGAAATADVVDGGDGTDTLNITAFSTTATDSYSADNIETLRIETDNTGGGAAEVLDLDLFSSDFTTVRVDVGLNGNGNSTTLQDVANASAILVTNNAAGTDATLTALNVTLTSDTGTADSTTITLTGNGNDTAADLTVSTLNVEEVETVNIVANATSEGSILVSAVTANDIDTLNISGAGDITVGANDTALTVLAISATAATGDVTLEIGAGAHDITGGSGDDTFDFNDNLTTTDTVDGGAGDDWLVAALAAGTAAAHVTNIENVSLEFGTAGATFSGANVSTALDTIEIADASDENVVLTNLKSAVTSIQLGATAGAAAGDAATIGYAAGSNAAHTILIGDDADTPADVDLGVLTLTGNAGALTITSQGDATDNSVYDITANAATSLTVVTDNAALTVDDTGAGDGTLNATAATSVNLRTAGGALTVDGAQDVRRATAITINAADGNITLTGAMTATAATSLTVTATDDFLQTGNFVSDADVTAVNLTATGIGSSIRYDGILDVDHVRAINLTAANGGSVTVDDIELLGVDNDGVTGIDTSLTISATGTDVNDVGSTVTVSAINVAAASTLDSVTITSDADGTVNFTVGGANLTITTIDASASAGTLVFDSSTSGAAIDLTTGTGDNTITTELDQADAVTLASGAGDDTIIILDDTTAADTITNFEAGANGDVISIDVSALIGGVVTSANDTVLSDALSVVITDDANGDAVALGANTNILRLTDTFTNIADVIDGLDFTGISGANVDDNEGFLVIWSDGGSTYVSTVLASANNGASFDAGADLVELVGVTVTDLTAANFAFV